MTTYEYLKSFEKICLEKMAEANKKKDLDLTLFYRNAARGFDIKAKNLAVREADIHCVSKRR